MVLRSNYDKPNLKRKSRIFESSRFYLFLSNITKDGKDLFIYLFIHLWVKRLLKYIQNESGTKIESEVWLGKCFGRG